MLVLLPHPSLVRPERRLRAELSPRTNSCFDGSSHILTLFLHLARCPFLQGTASALLENPLTAISSR